MLELSGGCPHSRAYGSSAWLAGPTTIRRSGTVGRRWAASRSSWEESPVRKARGDAEEALAEPRLRRLQAAIEAGVDPAALVESINEAQAQSAAARAGLERALPPSVFGGAEVYVVIDSLGDVGAVLKYANPDNLERLYDKLDVQLEYEPTGARWLRRYRPVWLARVSKGELHTIHPAAAGRLVEGYALWRGSRARLLHRTGAGAVWSES